MAFQKTTIKTFKINVIKVSMMVSKCNTDQSWSFKVSFALFITGVKKKHVNINKKLMKVRILNMFGFELIILIINAPKDIRAIIKKNLGQMYLKKILESWVLIILFTAGATKIDWNKIIPIITPENINGKLFTAQIYKREKISARIKLTAQF